MPRHLYLVVFLTAVLVMLLAGVSQAETGISMYTGETFVQDTTHVLYHSSNTVSRLEHFDASRTRGIHLDSWGDKDWRWLGWELDLSSLSI